MKKTLLIGLIVAVGLIFLFNNSVSAQNVTIEDLQKQIRALQEQIAALQNRLKLQQSTVQTLTTPSPTFGQNIADFNKNLYFGLRQNADVMDIQEFLTDQGYYAGPITGNFGLLTLQAVRKFQQTQGINPTGYWGPLTRASANQIMRKIVGIICKSEESCPGDVLPSYNLKITSDSLTGDSTLPGIVGTYFVVNFKVSGGSGNYEITPQNDNLPGLSFTRTYCPSGLVCAQVISPDTITLYGTPVKAGVYDVVIVARDSYKCTTNVCPMATSPAYYPNSYGKARFSVIIKDKTLASQPPVISGVSGPTQLKTGEVGIWTVNASNPQGGNLSYRVVWGDEITAKEGTAVAPQAVPFIQTANFSHVYQYPSVFSPIFYVVNDRGQEAKTSISVNVIGTGTQPSITVTSPNGGESFKNGGYVYITWVNNSLASNQGVQLQLWDETGSKYLAPICSFCKTAIPTGDAGYNWYVSNDLTAGKYRIRASVVSTLANDISATAVDFSDAPFSIVAGTTVTPPAGLIAHWKFDEGSGTTASDSSGNGNNGTLTNGPLWITGKSGRAIQFDKIDDVVKIDAPTAFDNLPQLTISAWINPKSAGEGGFGRIIEKADGVTNPTTRGWNLYVTSSNQIAFAANFASANLDRRSSANTLTLNQWQYVTLTWDGSSSVSGVHFYVNGNEVTYATNTSGSGTRVLDDTEDLRIGNNESGARTFDGAIDEVKVYNRALTPEEVRQVATAQTARSVNTSLTPHLQAAILNISAQLEEMTRILRGLRR